MPLTNPPNPRADGGEFFLDALVAAIDMVDTVDRGFSLRDQRREDQRCAGTQV